MNYAYIIQKIAAICPVESLNSDGKITFPEDVTEKQKSAATALFNKFLASDDNATLEKIEELESTITPRRRDEAILGTDGGWLSKIRNDIANLRATLTA